MCILDSLDSPIRSAGLRLWSYQTWSQSSLEEPRPIQVQGGSRATNRLRDEIETASREVQSRQVRIPRESLRWGLQSFVDICAVHNRVSRYSKWIRWVAGALSTFIVCSFFAALESKTFSIKSKKTGDNTRSQLYWDSNLQLLIELNKGGPGSMPLCRQLILLFLVESSRNLWISKPLDHANGKGTTRKGNGLRLITNLGNDI